MKSFCHRKKLCKPYCEVCPIQSCWGDEAESNNKKSSSNDHYDFQRKWGKGHKNNEYLDIENWAIRDEVSKKKKKRFYRKKTATRRQGSLSKLSSKKIFGIDMGDTKQNEWVSTRDEKMMKLRV